jgi:hypothetical protein
MASIGFFIWNRESIWSRAANRVPWVVIGVIWSIGMAFLVYHQVWALSREITEFGGKSREEVHRLLNGGSLLDDMVEVSQLLDGQSRVKLTVSAGAPPFWQVRAAHYLFPIIVRADSPMRIHYFGKPHRPCGEVAEGWVVVRDAERYCLFQRAG